MLQGLRQEKLLLDTVSQGTLLLPQSQRGDADRAVITSTAILSPTQRHSSRPSALLPIHEGVSSMVTPAGLIQWQLRVDKRTLFELSGSPILSPVSSCESSCIVLNGRAVMWTLYLLCVSSVYIVPDCACHVLLTTFHLIRHPASCSHAQPCSEATLCASLPDP